MTTTKVICKMISYVDPKDYNAPGTFTSMIQMKTRLETLEEATKRTIFEEELDKKCKSITDQYITYLDKNDYKTQGIFTSMIQMKTRLETLEEKNEREKNK